MKIEINNVNKYYDKKAVLNVDNISIDSSGCTAIIGPNGAGKTTLVNIIAGLDEPSQGTILYDERKYIPRRDISLVFQTPYMLRTTVEMNIKYPMKLRKWPVEKIEKRTEELIKKLRLTEFKNKKAWKLSGGETQKVALARALSFKPKLLLLDEPTSNVDPGTTAEIEEMLVNVNKEDNIDIFIVTHNLSQAKRLCQNAIFMNQGKIIEQGNVNQILVDPKHQQTKTFINNEVIHY